MQKMDHCIGHHRTSQEKHLKSFKMWINDDKRWKTNVIQQYPTHMSLCVLKSKIYQNIYILKKNIYKNIIVNRYLFDSFWFVLAYWATPDQAWSSNRPPSTFAPHRNAWQGDKTVLICPKTKSSQRDSKIFDGMACYLFIWFYLYHQFAFPFIPIPWPSLGNSNIFKPTCQHPKSSQELLVLFRATILRRSKRDPCRSAKHQNLLAEVVYACLPYSALN